jgi:AraC-like DNA-binding protein
VEAAVAYGLAQGQGATDLVAVAIDAGFSDQSHLGREVRRLTVTSPSRLEASIRSDEVADGGPRVSSADTERTFRPLS